MRIGVLTTSFPRTEGDPAGNFVAGFARWLAVHQGDVEVLCADEKRPLFYRGGALSSLRGMGYLHAARFSARLAGEAAVRAHRWDAVVSHWLVPAGAIGAALGGRRRPHLAIAHGSDARLLSRLPLGRSLAKAISRRADLVYVSRSLVLDQAPGRVVPMGIECSEVAGGKREATRIQRRFNRFTVLFLGRMTLEKGGDLAIAALPANSTLVMAGAGPLEPEWSRLAASLCVDVRFVGEVRGPEKRDLLAAADLLVVPSRAEGSPTVLLEALAAGLPIVATTVGGIPERLIHEESGILCPPNDPQALRAAIERVASDSSLCQRLAARGPNLAAAHDWSVVGPRLSRLFGQAAAAKEGRITVARI